ncbi:MAG: pyruvate formate lyase family protein [Armatimonadota bacterium]
MITADTAYAALRKELRDYYQVYDNTLEMAVRARLDGEAEAEPHMPAPLRKARMHEIIAEMTTPVIFRHTPFPFECGLRPGASWGCSGVATWMHQRYHDRFDEEAHQRLLPYIDAGISTLWDAVDFDHYSIGYDAVLERGYLGLIEDAEAALALAENDEARHFLTAVIRSYRALLGLIERFADRAEQLAASETDADIVRRLTHMATALRHVPAHPPRTFYEALLTLSATRELFATFEGVGISILGHLDRQLGPFYAADVAAGRLTEAEAADLLARYLLLTDLRFDVRSGRTETSTTMTLGGCDADGTPVFNEVTRLILRVHQEQQLLNPKPQCRISNQSPEAYLRELAAAIAGGHNTLGIFNDEVLIPAQHKMGKRLEDCRLYVNGGCQETMLLGSEFSAGAYWYFNLTKVLELTLNPRTTANPLSLTPLTSPATFADVYQRVMGNLRAVIASQANALREWASAWPEVNPYPLLSATIADCLATGKDLTQGGGRYSPTGICFVGIATLADSLQAIRLAVFEQQFCSYEELIQALAANFNGDEELQARLRRLPHFGQDHADTDRFTAQVAHDLAQACHGLQNERGGPYQPALFSYTLNQRMGGETAATPDGRAAGERLSQGASPSSLAHIPSLAHLLSSMSAVDYTEFPASPVIDLQVQQVPNREEMTSHVLALLKTFIQLNGPLFQCSLVDPAILRDAQNHPELYPDLVVRIAGFSIYYTTLPREAQDEFITRTRLAVGA